MRIWHLPFKYLDSRRLVAQHHELHAICSMIIKGRKWGTITDQFRDKWGYLYNVHDRYLLESSVRKGLNLDHDYIETHKTPLPSSTGFGQDYFKVTDDHLRLDVISLREKWETEGYYFGVGRLDLVDLEVNYGLPIGSSPIECLKIQKQTREKIKKCPQFFKALTGRFGWKLKLYEELNIDVAPFIRDAEFSPEVIKQWQRRINAMDKGFREDMKARVASLPNPV